MTTLRRRPALLTWGKARKLRKLRLDVGNEILLGMDDMQYHVDAKSQYTHILPSPLAISRGRRSLGALSPGQARAQPEPSPSPVVRLGPEIL